MVRDLTVNGKATGAFEASGYDATGPTSAKCMRGGQAYMTQLKAEKEVRVEQESKGSIIIKSTNHPMIDLGSGKMGKDLAYCICILAMLRMAELQQEHLNAYYEKIRLGII